MLALRSSSLSQGSVNQQLNADWFPVAPIWLQFGSNKKSLVPSVRRPVEVGITSNRATDVRQWGTGHLYNNSGSGDFLTNFNGAIFAAGQTKLTLICVCILDAAVSSGGLVCGRSGSPGMGGIVMENGGLQVRSNFANQSYWSVNTGFPNINLGDLIVTALTVDCERNFHAIAYNGNTFTYAGTTVSTFDSGTVVQIGQDPSGSTRTITGNIFMSGIIVGDSWSLAKCQKFTQNPWQVFK